MTCLILKYKYDIVENGNHNNTFNHMTFVVLNKDESKIFLKKQNLFKIIKFQVTASMAIEYTETNAKLKSKIEIKNSEYLKYKNFYHNKNLHRNIFEKINIKMNNSKTCNSETSDSETSDSETNDSEISDSETDDSD